MARYTDTEVRKQSIEGGEMNSQLFSKRWVICIALCTILVVMISPVSSEAGVGKIVKFVTYPVWKPADLIFVDLLYGKVLKPGVKKGEALDRESKSTVGEGGLNSSYSVYLSQDGSTRIAPGYYIRTQRDRVYICAMGQTSTPNHFLSKATITYPVATANGVKTVTKTISIGRSSFGMGYQIKSFIRRPKGMLKAEMTVILTGYFDGLYDVKRIGEKGRTEHLGWVTAEYKVKFE